MILDNNKVNIIAARVEYSFLQDLSMLVKAKLSLSVVFTSMLGYIIASGSGFNLNIFMLLSIGGFLVTFAANAMNEILEKDFDSLMTRTANRPLAAGRMKVSDAVLFAGISCLIGVSLLAFINPLSSVLGMLSFVIYSFVYTPLKRISTLAVAVGAIPGALPVLIGCTAFDGTISIMGLGLFAIQFLWQFPHFWSIGFLSFEDYSKAGYKLLPQHENGEIDTSVSLHSLSYSILIIPCLLIMFFFNVVNINEFLMLILCSLIYIIFAFKFYKKTERKEALALMFSSFFFMPMVLLTIIFL